MAYPIFGILLGIGLGFIGALFLVVPQITAGNTSHQGRAPRPPLTPSYVPPTPPDGNVYETKDGEECSVCVKSMKKEEMHKFKCGHAVHKKCYEKLPSYSCPFDC